MCDFAYGDVHMQQPENADLNMRMCITVHVLHGIMCTWLRCTVDISSCMCSIVYYAHGNVVIYADRNAMVTCTYRFTCRYATL